VRAPWGLCRRLGLPFVAATFRSAPLLCALFCFALRFAFRNGDLRITAFAFPRRLALLHSLCFAFRNGDLQVGAFPLRFAFRNSDLRVGDWCAALTALPASRLSRFLPAILLGGRPLGEQNFSAFFRELKPAP
jgi:hypothetical protein